MKRGLEHLGTFKDWNDGTLKAVYRGERGIIETTLLFNKTDRNSDVYCVPTHHYCNLSCVMCHLTAEGVNKRMIPIKSNELIESILRTSSSVKENKRWSENKYGWLSFMGVGDPLLNLEILKEIFEKESELKKGGNYEDLSYSLSTMMPNHELNNLTEYAHENSFPLKVHFSMHSPFSDQRFFLLPKTKVSVEEALELMKGYRSKIITNKKVQDNFSKFKRESDPVEIHYTLIKGLNDSDEHLHEVKNLLKKFMIPFKILSFNPISNLKKSDRDGKWINFLQKEISDLKIRIYNPPGHQVGSSCGEFTKHYYHSKIESENEKREFEEWKNKHQIE